MADHMTLVACPCCDGAGEWDEGPLPASSWASEPDYRQVFCPQCGGTGKAWVECEPITLEDIEEMAADECAAYTSRVECAA